MKQGVVALVLLGCLALAWMYPRDTKPVWPKPKLSVTPDSNLVNLGRHLFYDPILSIDSTISCGHCHLQYSGFTHVDHATSHGIFGRIGTRNAPVLINLAWNPDFMWDGAVNHLEVQPLAPIKSDVEMGEDPQRIPLKLKRNAKYPKLFSAAFGDDNITGQRMLKALSAFMQTLVSNNSKYDQVMRGEQGVAFSPQEEAGLKTFRQFCASCHAEPLFTNHAFENIGLPLDTALNDLGRYAITHKPEDSLKFKVPTLRNIEFSYPYMHDGRFKTLKQVLKHYTSGIENNANLSPKLKKLEQLPANETANLVAFLLTLSDKQFLFSRSFNPPHPGEMR